MFGKDMKQALHGCKKASLFKKD